MSFFQISTPNRSVGSGSGLPYLSYDWLTEYSSKFILLPDHQYAIYAEYGDALGRWRDSLVEIKIQLLRLSRTLIYSGFRSRSQKQMKITKDTIYFFESLYWDYQVSEENIITIIESGECNGLTRKNLLSRALKSRRWYEIKKILSAELLKEALSEDVLNTLFPKSLLHQYNYVKKILYK